MSAQVILRRAALPTAAVALGVLVAAPSVAAAPGGSAQAAVVTLRGQSLSYTAAPGQANRVIVTMAQGETQYLFTYTIDDVYEISVGFGNCTHPVTSDLTKVVCTLEVSDDTDPFYAGKFYLEDKNDTLRYLNPSGQSYAANQFWLGGGDDKAVTRQSNDGNDGSSVLGQNGKDVIDAGDGSDLSFLLGGNGDDTIYVDGVGDGGPANGGNGNDKIYGRRGAQSMSGGDGNDLLDAGDGADLLNGGPGNDRLWGRKGDDRIFGNSGNDELHGGLGKDQLSGGPGKDVIVQN